MIIPRQQAISSGLKKYFTGKPCKHGHIAERYIPGNACCECQAIGSTLRAAANPKQKLFWGVKARALKEGTDFSIEFDDLFWPSVCPVLGIQIVYGNLRSNWNHSPSIDRIDNAQGYTSDNTIVVSWRANRIKSDSTPAELLALASFYNSKH